MSDFRFFPLAGAAAVLIALTGCNNAKTTNTSSPYGYELLTTYFVGWEALQTSHFSAGLIPNEARNLTHCLTTP